MRNGGNSMKQNDITPKLRDRFCKDCNIPIKLFKDPHFSIRLALMDKHYDTLNKWKLFISEMESYKDEQEYFDEYNMVKDEAIKKIQSSKAYQQFNSEDMNKFAVSRTGSDALPSKAIYKSSNEGKVFISIDMKKANFTALRHYDKTMFMCSRADSEDESPAETWEEFIRQFTKNEHIIRSKYIRQVILGNCNPKRHITYEKHLMEKVLDVLLEDEFLIEEVVFFSNDELVFDVTDSQRTIGRGEQDGTVENESLPENEITVSDLRKLEDKLADKLGLPFRVEMFTLHKINGTDGYIKKIKTEPQADGSEYKLDFKCLDNLKLPFVLRIIQGQEIVASDRMFYHEGLLAEFVETPEIGIEASLIEKD